MIVPNIDWRAFFVALFIGSLFITLVLFQADTVGQATTSIAVMGFLLALYAAIREVK